MTRSRLPLVCDKHVHELTGPVDSPTPIVVGTDAWYTLLMDQQIQSFSFRHHLGTFTIRRERKRHGLYWYAYHKLAGRLRKAYLGKSEELTLERLNAVADALIGQGKNDDDTQVHPDEPDPSALLLSPETANGNGLSFQTSAFTYPTEQGQTLKHNLPARLTPVIGREQDVAAVCSFLRQPEVRLLTLTGAGGVGKTCLGLQIATDLLKDFADGVCFVSLAPISDPDLVMPAIAQTLGIKEPGDQPFRELLAAYLVEKHLLLFLDNFEQVIDTAPALIELLGRCPSLKILVTSREVLRVRAEQEFPVLPLALPNLSHLPEPECVSQYAAVALFLQRARCYRPDFQLTAANARTIAAICVHLDGLPLALELAAARLKLLSPRALLARLANRLQVLTQGPRDVHSRHQTLRNTLQWSYDLLDTHEQRLFRRLAVFVSGCTLEAVDAVCKASGDEMMNVFDSVASLLDKNLVQQQRGQRDEEPRLVMLATIREYGLESLAMSGELETTRRVHANYYLALAEEFGSRLGDPNSALWLERLEQEHDNLRAAMWWSLELGEGEQDTNDSREIALRFGAALRGFWIIHSHWSEGRTFLERALAASEGAVTSMRVKALEAAASLAVYQVDHDRGEALCRESLALCRERGDAKGTAFSLYLLGTIDWQRGDFAMARALMEESLALYKEVGDQEDVAGLLTCLGQLATPQGEYDKARAFLDESLAIERELGDARGIAISLFSLALALFVSQGDPATVHALLGESLGLSRELGDKATIARCLSHAGLVTLQQGDTAVAHRLSEESLALHRETGDQWGISWVLSILAKVKAREGDQRAAFTLYQESLAIARKIGSKLNIAVCLEGMASILATQGEPLRAARLWGAAEALRDTMGAPIWPVERAAYERTVAAARSLIGRKVFVAAWAEGRTIPLEDVLADRKNTRTPQQALTSPHSIAVLSPSSDAGLTSREIDVLSLLAQGLTSAQIARRLMISLVTVNTHVRSIYTKLGVTSRSSATRYAVEHHLV